MDAATLKKVDRIWRNYLWYGCKDANGGHSAMNWHRMCRPLQLRGLGILDLHRMGITL